MPLFPTSLKNLLTQRFPPDRALSYFSQILDGVEAAHIKQVVHRDLKPENILYDKGSDTLLIADFGIAHFHEDDMYTYFETKTGTRLANFLYSAPEQRIRGGIADRRMDIYALGLILNELFTNSVPQGTGHITIGSKIPDLAYLDDLVDRMRRQDPSERPSSIEEIKQLLKRYQSDIIISQKLSKVTNTVVPEREIDDPIAVKPPKLDDIEWTRGVLTLILSRAVNEDWKWALLNMGNYTSVSGKGPEQFSIKGNQATITAEEHEVHRIVDLFKEWLPLANAKYTWLLKHRLEKASEAERLRLSQEREDLETQKRLRQRVKI